MNKVCSLSDAIERFVNSGDCVAFGGFTTSRKPPLTAVCEIIRQGQTGLPVNRGPQMVVSVT